MDNDWMPVLEAECVECCQVFEPAWGADADCSSNPDRTSHGH